MPQQRRPLPELRLEDMIAEMDRLGPENALKFEDWGIVPSEWPQEDWSDIAPRGTRQDETGEFKRCR
jgi:hypothetical protein